MVVSVSIISTWAVNSPTWRTSRRRMRVHHFAPDMESFRMEMWVKDDQCMPLSTV